MANKGAATRDKILCTARQLFQARGFNAVSVSDLVDALGMCKGSLYFHFAGKEELAHEVLAAAAGEFTGFLDRTLAAADPVAALDDFFSAVLDAHLAAGFVGGCLFGNTALEMSDSDPALTRMVEEVFAAWIDRIAAVVERAQRQGRLRGDLPSAALATQIVAVVEGGIMMSRLQKDEAPLRRSLVTLRALLGLPSAGNVEEHNEDEDRNDSAAGSR